MFRLDTDNINQDEEFDNLQVNKIKTDKLNYSYYNNIIYIDSKNSKNLALNKNDSDSLIVTDDSELDINIILNSRTVGTHYKILITNIQNSLRICCLNESDKFVGNYKLNHNSNIIETSDKDNKQKKQFVCKSNNIGNQILFIPNYDLGLYNGGFLELTYLGTKYNNNTEIKSNQNSDLNEGNWLVKGNLVGRINIPQTITPNISKTLKIYLNLSDKIIDYVTSTNNNNRYFNKLYNNQNIILFLTINYDLIQIIDSNNNNILYDSSITIQQNYNLQIKDKTGVFIDSMDKLNFDTIDSDINHIQSLFDTINNTIKNVENQNILEYKIIDNVNNQSLILEGVFNIIDINAYFDSIENINFENIIFSVYNGFTNINNKLNNTI